MPTNIDTNAIAQEITEAYATHQVIAVPPTARGIGFDMPAAYAVEDELVRQRRTSGRKTVGLKLGFANRAVWRALKLDTLAWAHMYDDTVKYAKQNSANVAVGRMYSAKIEPEIVFKLKRTPTGGDDPSAVLEAVEWLALGYEVIDCLYADWKFQPPDLVAAYGLHAALVIGDTRPVRSANIPALAAQLASFTATLSRNGETMAEGGGKNVLQSPALCLGELAAAISRHPTAEPLAAGDIITTGALADNKFIAPGETWTTKLQGLDLPGFTVHIVA
jgi:2-oxo-3-hexenedioate decarboxylase